MKRLSWVRAAAAAAVLLAATLSAGARAESPTGPRKVTSLEGITEYVLDNGLRVLLYPDLSTPNVTVNLTVLVGSRHEGYGETGMAHLLEHMVFKGTPTHPDVPKALRDHGARFNGTTWVDRTNYFETMPASDENLEFALRLEADRLVNSLIKREDLASEMTVVRNEFEMGENDPGSILSQRMMATAYEWHNYGKSTIGNRSDIERVPIERLQGFYRKHYQPDNAVLVVAGNFDEAKALKWITRYFGSLKKPERRLETTYTEEPAQDGERTVVLRRVGKVGVAGLVYHIPAGSHPDFPALEVLASLLDLQPSGRLYQALVQTKKANSVDASAFGWHDPGVLEVTAEVGDASDLEPVRDTMIRVTEGLATDKISPEDVERVKTRLLKDRELLMKDTNRIGVALSDWAAKGDWRLFFLHRDRLEKVTPADVARVAGLYLRPSNRTVGLYFPSEQVTRTPIPETPKVADLVKDYKSTRTVAAGESFDPTPENLDKRVVRAELPGGGKLVMLPKKSRGESVTLGLRLRYGNDEALKGRTTAAQFLGTLMARGTKSHTRQQLEDELDKLKARLVPSSGLGEVGFTVEARKDTLPAVVQLLGEVLREPTFPEDEFEVLKRQSRDRIKAGMVEPQMLAAQALQRKLSPYPPEDVRYVPTMTEALERVDRTTVADIRKLYEDMLGGGTAEVAVVGDIDAAATTKLIGELVGGWQAKTPYRRIERPAKTDVAGERVVIETPDKANAVYISGENLALTDADPDYPALAVGNFILGAAPLSSRLSVRVRGKEGLSYGVGSQFRADALDKSAPFLVFAISNPQNVAKVDKAVGEEIARFLKDGPEAKELDEAKKAYLQQMKIQRSDDRQVTAQLLENLHAGRTFAYQAELEKKVAGLEPGPVREVFARHLDPRRLVTVEAGDFKKKPAE